MNCIILTKKWVISLCQRACLWQSETNHKKFHDEKNIYSPNVTFPKPLRTICINLIFPINFSFYAKNNLFTCHACEYMVTASTV